MESNIVRGAARHVLTGRSCCSSQLRHRGPIAYKEDGNINDQIIVDGRID